VASNRGVRLRHWRCEEEFGELFEGKRDYADWICLRLEAPDSIGPRTSGTTSTA